MEAMTALGLGALERADLAALADVAEAAAGHNGALDIPSGRRGGDQEDAEDGAAEDRRRWSVQQDGGGGSFIGRQRYRCRGRRRRSFVGRCCSAAAVEVRFQVVRDGPLHR